MQIKIKVKGTFCNTWPNLVVECNKQILFNGLIENTQTIDIEFTKLIPTGNIFYLGMDNKSFGKNNIWDTRIVNNQIVEDKTIKVLSVELDGVECVELFNNRFHVKVSDKQPSYFPDTVPTDNVMNYNGYFYFNFDLPLYNSLINRKFKKESSDDISYFSNYSKVFHYDDQIKAINDIKKQLKEVDEKFSDKRSAIRNT